MILGVFLMGVDDPANRGEDVSEPPTGEHSCVPSFELYG